MEALKIEAGKDTPKVNLDAQSGRLFFAGQSLPEDVNMFYKPILQWFDDYIQTPNASTIFIAQMNYINSASTKIFYIILEKLELLMEAGNSVHAFWYYPPDDEDLEELGEEYKSNIHIPFELMKLK